MAKVDARWSTEGMRLVWILFMGLYMATSLARSASLPMTASAPLSLEGRADEEEGEPEETPEIDEMIKFRQQMCVGCMISCTTSDVRIYLSTYLASRKT